MAASAPPAELDPGVLGDVEMSDIPGDMGGSGNMGGLPLAKTTTAESVQNMLEDASKGITHGPPALSAPSALASNSDGKSAAVLTSAPFSELAQGDHLTLIRWGRPRAFRIELQHISAVFAVSQAVDESILDFLMAWCHVPPDYSGRRAYNGALARFIRPSLFRVVILTAKNKPAALSKCAADNGLFPSDDHDILATMFHYQGTYLPVVATKKPPAIILYNIAALDPATIRQFKVRVQRWRLVMQDNKCATSWRSAFLHRTVEVQVKHATHVAAPADSGLFSVLTLTDVVDYGSPGAPVTAPSLRRSVLHTFVSAKENDQGAWGKSLRAVLAAASGGVGVGVGVDSSVGSPSLASLHESEPAADWLMPEFQNLRTKHEVVIQQLMDGRKRVRDRFLSPQLHLIPSKSIKQLFVVWTKVSDDIECLREQQQSHRDLCRRISNANASTQSAAAGQTTQYIKGGHTAPSTTKASAGQSHYVLTHNDVMLIRAMFDKNRSASALVKKVANANGTAWKDATGGGKDILGPKKAAQDEVSAGDLRARVDGLQELVALLQTARVGLVVKHGQIRASVHGLGSEDVQKLDIKLSNLVADVDRLLTRFDATVAQLESELQQSASG